jgi:hypothetical protein
VGGFLARQFLDFLGARAMNLAQVGWQMPEGVRALSNLMTMLFQAAGACKVSAHKSSGWDYLGLRLDGKYWVGVEFSEPEKLWFSTLCRVNPEAAAKLGVGELQEDTSIPGGHQWCREVELQSEPAVFFARSKVSQMRWLEGFLRECLSQARSIEIPDQPPIPEEPEGN